MARKLVVFNVTPIPAIKRTPKEVLLMRENDELRWMIDMHGHDETRYAIQNMHVSFITYPDKWHQKPDAWDIGAVHSEIFKKCTSTDAFIFPEDYKECEFLSALKPQLEMMGCLCLVVGEDAQDKILEKWVEKGGTVNEL